MLERMRKYRASRKRSLQGGRPVVDDSIRAARIEARLRGDYLAVESDRLAAITANSELSYAASDADAAERFAEFRQRDPFPSIPPALLNSADIADYASATGMIYPFDPSKLKTASYEVGVLGDYVIHTPDGGVVEGNLAKGEQFMLPKDSIAYLSVEPKFRLPDYIAVRHNLKIKNIYRGLLVGTGPLIDPGFVGKIALPLHNLTDSDYTIEAGEGTIWVEFTKLSPSPRWSDVSTDERQRRGAYIPFPTPPLKDKGPTQYVNDAVGARRVPGSSTAAIAKEAKQARKAARTARNLTWAGFVVIFISAAALVVVPLTMLQPRIDSHEDQIANLEHEIAELRESHSNQPASPTSPPTEPVNLP